jgi:hypothetical protein
MEHSFLQWSETLSGHIVTEEGDLGCSEDALQMVDQDPIRLKKVEDNRRCRLFSSDQKKMRISSKLAKQKSSSRRMSSMKS